MDKYYYFIAQLPTLFFGKESVMSVDNFLEEGSKWISPRDYKILSLVDINDFSVDKKVHPVFFQFKLFESKLRNDIALWRKAQKQNQEYKPSSIAASTLKEGTPLDIEIRLMELRWNFLDDMHREHHFDLGFLILYYLKLQILRRYFTFNKEQGLEKFQKLYEVNVWSKPQEQ